jgi:hypothetical protein
VENVFRQVSELHQTAAEPATLNSLMFQSRIQLFASDEVTAEEQIAQPGGLNLVSGNRHTA